MICGIPCLIIEMSFECCLSVRMGYDFEAALDSWWRDGVLLLVNNVKIMIFNQKLRHTLDYLPQINKIKY